ncbi:MAG: HPr-rel-A system PqqD family peptide chaperone [Massilia sp.]|nr:HPr-rel-A system PqqD family peptide chaperone [Massilia sp.]
MWRLIHGQTLQQRRWGDETVLYNDLSGDTHLLGATAICLLQALQASARDEATLVALVCAQLQVDADDTVAHETALLLASLCALSLIERRAC